EHALVGALLVGIAESFDVGGRHADGGAGGSNFEFAGGCSDGALDGFAVLHYYSEGFIGGDGIHLIPWRGDDAEEIALDGDGLGVLLDDAASSSVGVLGCE